MHTNKNSATWVLVADNSQAKIYRLVKFPKLEEIAQFEHAESRMQNSDLVSSKPGRSTQRMGGMGYSYEPDTEPKFLEAIKFATEIAKHLSEAEQKGEFNRLYIFAGPTFLGLLRQHITAEVQKVIAAEVHKELTHSKIADIEHHLSEI